MKPRVALGSTQGEKARLQKDFGVQVKYDRSTAKYSGVRWSTHSSSVAFSSLHRPLLLIIILNKLVPGANFRGRSKPTDRILSNSKTRGPNVGPQPGIRSDPLSDSLKWDKFIMFLSFLYSLFP
jgi:hypothetical protein